MKKKIKHVSELPNWFNLTKYESAKSLDAAGWYEQLYVRIETKKIIDFRKNGIIVNTYDEEFLNNTSNIGDILKLIREQPIVDVNSNDLLSHYFYLGRLRELKPKKLYFALGIHPLTINNLIEIENFIEEKELETFRLCNQNSYYFPHSMIERLDEPVSNISVGFNPTANNAAYVNWDLPDELLIEHFKQYVTTFRPYKNKNHTKRYRNPDFNSWYRFGVLPYLDLKIWAIENEVTIPNRVMADALFAHGEGGEETIRKTTTPLAKMLDREETLELLAFQASLKIAEQNKLKRKE